MAAQRGQWPRHSPDEWWPAVFRAILLRSPVLQRQTVSRPPVRRCGTRQRASPSASRGAAVLCLMLSCSCSAGCRATDREPLRASDETLVAGPAFDIGESCTDAGASRVCSGARCGPTRLCVTPRPLPASIRGHGEQYRCAGHGEKRTCVLRVTRASSFQCANARCVQRRPRLPDDGDWECNDLGGAVLCRGGGELTGVARRVADGGWTCGSRPSRRRGRVPERLCLDLDPDYPAGIRDDFVCHFATEGSRPVRHCEPGTAFKVGDVCANSSECPLHARCVAKTCVLQSWQPNCWADIDCASGVCRFGTCREERG